MTAATRHLRRLRLRPYQRSASTSPPSRSSALTVAAVLVVAVPFAIVLVRLLADTRHVYLPDDLALIDMHVRDAIHWRQQLGPFDRFGWSHPGAAYFYLLSLPARALGSGARADFVGATLINAACALGVVWLVRRRSGAAAGLWAALCVGLLAFVLASTDPGALTFSEGPLGAVVSPWNPDVVIFPLLLFGTVCVLGSEGSVLFLLAAALLGSFTVQTNLATAPLVVVLFAIALIAAVVRRVRARRSRPGTRLLGGRPPWLFVGGLVVLVLMWVPPVLQQLGNSPGNLSLIWQFFTAHHPTQSLSTALWSVVAVDGSLGFGVAKETTPYVLGDPRHYAGIVLAVVLLVGVVAVGIGVRRRSRFAAGLGIASLIGFVVTVISATRIVGLVFGYLVIWEIAVPVLGLIGLGVALLGTSDEAALVDAEPETRPTSRWWSRLPAPILVAVAVLLTVTLAVEMIHLPPLRRASDPDVAMGWRLVSANLKPGEKPVFIGDQGTKLEGLFTFLGLVNELDARGYQPRVNKFWQNHVGTIRLSTGPAPVAVTLYPPSQSVEQMPGYVGHTTYGDIVMTRPAPAS